MANIITDNVIRLFQTDSYIYCSMPNPEFPFKEWIMKKHKWDNEQWKEYKRVYHNYILTLDTKWN